MKRDKIRSTQGVTIVEVLVVLAVLSLAFVTAYSISIKSLGQSRNAQEHSETLGIITTQTEWLRTALAQGLVPPVNTPFCMISPTAFNNPSTQPFLPGNTVSGIASADDFTKYPAVCVSANGLYHSSIIYAGDPTGNFDIKLRWDGNDNTGRQQEEINYRLHPLTMVKPVTTKLALSDSII